MVESVAQQMRNCVCKMQTATIGTRPPLVASQYIIFPIIGESTVNARNLVNLPRVGISQSASETDDRHYFSESASLSLRGIRTVS